MEIHARYIWVGLVTFIAILGTVWYILWISTSKDGASQSLYDIYFSQNIAGLQEGSSVLLRGVPVGRVMSIRFDPKHAEQVRVRIQVTSTAPIRQDSIATIEPQGITGLANIQITGGSPSSPYLRPFDVDDVPVITAGTSRFEEILSAVPNILVTTTTILNKINDVVNEDNIRKIENILTNVDSTVENLANQKHAINSFLSETTDAFIEFKQTNTMLSSYINNQLKPLTYNISAIVERIPQTMENLNNRIDDVAALTVDTQKTIIQAKLFIITLDKALQQFRANPKQFLFGSTYLEHSQ